MTFTSAKQWSSLVLPNMSKWAGGTRLGRRLFHSIGYSHKRSQHSPSLSKPSSEQIDQWDGTDHISEAIVLDCQALDRCPPGHEVQWSSLDKLGGHLWGRYNHLGAVEDVEEAVIYGREALELCPDSE
jgi:hypothetical protein